MDTSVEPISENRRVNGPVVVFTEHSPMADPATFTGLMGAPALPDVYGVAGEGQ
ncbi:hypothetical protein GCM10010357_14160 [Streptomyces luteireticuli]|uniref:Uncharacterized protein n=1 Tax=Streptomyces luteireticuli TaxID=173858 RepID=A0ABP3IAM5_9ACTN